MIVLRLVIVVVELGFHALRLGFVLQSVVAYRYEI